MSWHAALLDHRDNVAVALRPIAAGERVAVRCGSGVVEVTALEAIPLCHKIALSDIAAGGKLLKHGACIGEARMPIARGAWVHTHNVLSLRARPRPAGPL